MEEKSEQDTGGVAAVPRTKLSIHRNIERLRRVDVFRDGVVGNPFTL